MTVVTVTVVIVTVVIIRVVIVTVVTVVFCRSVGLSVGQEGSVKK